MKKTIIAVFMVVFCAALFAQNTESDFAITADGTITKYEGWDANVVIPARIGSVTVRAIGPRAFESNDLTGVTIPAGVTSIGERAFANNQLTTITIPSSVTSIGNEAFRSNRLTNITISGNNVSIGSSAFRDNQLTSVTISGNGVNIGSSAFVNNQVTSLTITGNVSSFGNEAFRNNRLTNITIPGNNVTIGSSAFRDNQLTGVTISGSNAIIRSEAFLGNSSLASITLGVNCIFSADIVPQISWNSSSSLYYDYICNDQKAGAYATNRPVGNVTREGDYSFYRTQYGAYISEYHGSGGNRLIIPSELGGLPVKAVSGFRSKNIARVQIPNSVTYIANNAFSGNQINTVVISENVIYIGNNAFENNQLATVTIPSKVVYIGENAFSNNQLTSIAIPDSVTYLAWGAFRNNQLTSITIPDGLTYSATVVTPGSAYNATLQGEQMYRVTIPTSGLTVYTESDMDTVLRIYNIIGDELAYDDDSGTGGNARISLLLSAGTYFISVRGYSGSTTGPYSLHVSTDSITNITPGRTHNATLQANDSHLYSVTVPAGRLTAYTESNMDTVMRVYNSSGTEIAYDDDSGSGGNARIRISVTAGTYFIRVWGYGGSYTGPYSLYTLTE